MAIAAVIFDMDGLLIDSEPLWRIAEIEVLSGVGAPITEEMARETTGLRTDEVVEHWYRRHPWPAPTRPEVAAAIIHRVAELVRERGEPMRGVGECLDRMAAAGYRLAVASSSPSDLIAVVLARLVIAERFAVVQSAEHEPFGKPHPGVYLAAAQRLGVPPVECVAVEDSPNGVIAALAARMRCVAVPDPALRDDRRFLAADAVLPDLTDFGPDLVRRLDG